MPILNQERGSMNIDIKKQNREAMKWILNIDEMKKGYFEQFSMFSTLGATVNDGMPRGTDTGNPCMNKAISLVDMEQRRVWIMAVESMEFTLSEKKRKYLELRREADSQIRDKHKPGPQGWVDYVQAKYVEWFKQRYGAEIYAPTKKTMCLWMNEIIDITIRLRYEILLNNGLLR